MLDEQACQCRWLEFDYFKIKVYFRIPLFSVSCEQDQGNKQVGNKIINKILILGIFPWESLETYGQQH